MKDIIEQTLRNEGGYSNHSKDRGRETYKGITRKFWGEWAGWAIIDRANRAKFVSDRAFTEYLSKDATLQALMLDFYKRNFWDKMRLDEVQSKKVQLVMFDFGVNFGTSRAVKYAQICSGAVVDSKIGPNTIAAINKSDEHRFVYQFLLECVEGYYSLVKKDDSQRVFLLGWISRVVHNYYKVRE